MSPSDGPALRLKSLELQGYKTFATKTPFTFAPTITAIVGPNGSGKSNIADAIRWVLGEQSYSLLRGKRTEDMIFTGSESRPRASMASATISFDNSDGWLPIDFTEVTISRRAFRDGQNEYFLNGQRVRLRDVLELLASCGLAQRTYTIIGQGLVDAALSLKAEERRRLFEEAAGIGLYRTRREEALRRLEKTRRNLERAQDILNELRPRLRSLERQAKRAGAYEQVRKDLRAALQIYYGYQWYSLLDRVKQAKVAVESKTQNRNQLRDKQAAAESDLLTTRRRVDALRSQLHTWSQQVSNLYAEREGVSRALAVSQERSRWLSEQEDLMRSEMEALQLERSKVKQRFDNLQEDIKRVQQEVMEARATHEELVKNGGIDLSDRQNLLERVKDARKALEDFIAEEGVWQAKASQHEERLNQLASQRAEIQIQIQQRADQAVEATRQVQAALEAKDVAVRTRKELENNEVKLRTHIQEMQDDLSANLAQNSDLRAKEASLRGRLQVLRSRSDEVEQVIARLAKAIREGRVDGMVGRFGKQMRVSPKYQRAIDAAMGDFDGSLAFRTLDDVLSALDWLEGVGKDGRAALLPLSTPRTAPHLEPPNDPDLVGRASDLVQVPSDYQKAIELLLGRTLIVRSRQAARRLLSHLPLDARLVTLRGDVYYPTGQVLLGGGEKNQVSPQVLGRVEVALNEVGRALKESQMEEKQLSGSIEENRKHLKELQVALAASREREADARHHYEQADLRAELAAQQREQILEQQRGLEEEIAQLEVERKALLDRQKTLGISRGQLEKELQATLDAAERAEPNVEMARLETRLELSHRANDEARRREVELEDRIARLNADIGEWQHRLEENRGEQVRMRNEVKAGEEGMRTVEQKLNALSNHIQPAEHELIEVEQHLSTIEVEESQIRTMLQRVEREHSHAQIELARKEEELISLKRRIEDDFGLVAFDPDSDSPGQEPLPLEGLVRRLPRVNELPLDAEDQVNRLRAQLRRIGAVNPEAQREYHEVRKRAKFLQSQVDDLRRAESQIHEVIAELDLLMEREFRKTFDAVAAAFRKTFTRLFGGGSARLVLTDPDDLNQTGIDIEAKLPGRREQGLAVLSGGERSLTASALIFALLEISPTPFCVLDEVDAMLDDANIIRFIDILQELSQKTQFILVTHNRLTVQAAEVVYGVSMEADSVSKVISLKLDQAKEMLAA